MEEGQEGAGRFQQKILKTSQEVKREVGRGTTGISIRDLGTGFNVSNNRNREGRSTDFPEKRRWEERSQKPRS